MAALVRRSHRHHNGAMKAMVLQAPAKVESAPLQLRDVPTPKPGAGEIRVRVHVCGVCRTDLHVVEGDLPPRRDRVIPGHQVVGVVDELGEGCTALVATACASASPGCAVRAVPATAAGAGTRTCAKRRRSPDTTPTADTPSTPSCDEDFAYAIPDVDRRRRGLAVALRRNHRLPRPAARRDAAGMPARSLRVRSLGAHRDPGGAPSRLPRLRDDTRARSTAGSPPSSAPNGPEPPTPAAGEARQRRAVRPRRRARTARPRGARPRRHARRRRDLSHRRSRRSITSSTSSTSATCAASPPIRAATAKSCCASPAEIPIRPHTVPFPLAEANRALQQLKHDGFEGAGVLTVQRDRDEARPR